MLCANSCCKCMSLYIITRVVYMYRRVLYVYTRVLNVHTYVSYVHFSGDEIRGIIMLSFFNLNKLFFSIGFEHSFH